MVESLLKQYLLTQDWLTLCLLWNVMVALTKINSNIIALLIIIFITIFRTVNRRYENPLILLTLSKKLDFILFSEKIILTWVHYKNGENFRSKKGFSGRLHSVSERAEDGLSFYHKISIFDFLTKIDLFLGEGGGLNNQLAENIFFLSFKRIVRTGIED